MYIHELKDWPYFYWDKDSVGAYQLRVSREASYLYGKLSSIGFQGQLQAVVESITYDVMCSSEIEGVHLNNSQVRSSIARKLGAVINDFAEPSHYIDGIVEMMLDSTTNYNSELTSERLFGWHSCLFPNGRSGYSLIDVAKYRTGAMRVVSGNYGRERVHYVAPDADRIGEEMRLFFSWFNSSSVTRDYVKSAIAHLWFVCIHPFDDGNGRIGRAIADMALQQADDSKMRFFSVSQQINADKKHYYDILERTQSKKSLDITEWLIWYLECIGNAIKNAERNYQMVVDKSAFWQNHSQTELSARQCDVINIYLDGYIGKLTAKNWAKLSKVSLDTASRDIKDLVSKNILTPNTNQARNVNYALIIGNGRKLDFLSDADL